MRGRRSRRRSPCRRPHPLARPSGAPARDSRAPGNSSRAPPSTSSSPLARSAPRSPLPGVPMRTAPCGRSRMRHSGRRLQDSCACTASNPTRLVRATLAQDQPRPEMPRQRTRAPLHAAASQRRDRPRADRPPTPATARWLGLPPRPRDYASSEHSVALPQGCSCRARCRSVYAAACGGVAAETRERAPCWRFDRLTSTGT